MVVLDYEFYRNRMLTEHLSDSVTYKMIGNYNVQHTITKIDNLIKKFKQSCKFTKNEINYLTKFPCDIPFLYGLPKIHKHQDYFKNTLVDNYGCISIEAPRDLKFRPIISSIYSPTSHLSQFIDDIIKPLLPFLDSYCRDTFHFLERLKHFNSSIDQMDDIVFITFDVSSLYTNINITLGMDAISYWLSTDFRHNTIPERFSDEFILTALKIILENNFFSFENTTYLQTFGTAMGTKVAPTYAILVMGFLEKHMYQLLKNVYDANVANNIQERWIRYIDDCFIIWDKKFGDINILDNILNNLHNDISFTKEYDNEKINFLDVLVYKEDRILETDIYRKITDSQNYVPFNSCHPKHIKKNIPFVLASRITKIVSKETRRIEQLDILKTQLLKLKYPLGLIESAFQRATSQSLNEKNEIQEDATKNIKFVTRYNTNNPDVYSKLIKPISSSLFLIDPFRHYKMTRVYKQPPSLYRILTNNNRCTIDGITKCGDPRCSCCPILITGKTLNLKVENRNMTFIINRNMNCQSRNVIYIIRCKGCNDIYVGQTGDLLRNRLTVHRQQINNTLYMILNVSHHISSCSRNPMKLFEAAPIYQMHPMSSRIDRERKEKCFISMLKPVLNSVT